MKTITQDLIKAFKRINKYGKSEITIDTYIRYICIDRRSMKRLHRNLAFAELMSRLAPPRELNDWYVAGLLNDVYEVNLPGVGSSPGIVKALLTKAQVTTSIVHAIENFRKMKDPRRWTPMIAALNFVDAHVEEGGDVISTSECCRIHGGLKRCNECMYARYFFAQTGMDKRAELIIKELREDFLRSGFLGEDSESTGEEGTNATERSMEKRSPAANAVATG